MAENRCFAYNKAGQRCDLDGGHASDHSIIMSWTDDECYTPGALVRSGVSLADTAKAVEQMGPVPVYGEGTPGMCVMCNHRMHGGECDRCDCKSGIPG